MVQYMNPYFFFVSVLLVLKLCVADILVYKAHNTNNTVEIIGDLPAFFGPPLPSSGFKGYVVHASPADACSVVAPPPKSDIKGPFIALVRRYNCSFVAKVLHAQSAGYKAVIVRNVGSNTVEVMNGDHDTELVHIPSIFIGQDDGILIQENFQYDSGYFVVLTDGLPFNIQNYLLPFAITIGICFILMLTFMLVKCVRDYRKSRRHRLSSRSLKKLPIHKFKKGDPYDCCAVCLEDYVDNDKLRVLPCSHAYHSKCIDPWLTKNRRVCPVCKRKVIIGNEQPSDLDSDTDDEAAPLINTGGGTQGGTFAHQTENPFREAEQQAERRRSGRRTQYHYLGESSSDEEDDHQESNPARTEYGNEDESQGEHEVEGDVNEVQVEDPSKLPHSNTEDCIV